MKRCLIALMLVACTLGLWAVPAKRITHMVKQPDGTLLTLTQGGDEFFHYLITDDGVAVKKQGVGYYYATIADGRVVASHQLAHSRDTRTAVEARFVANMPSIQDMREVALQSAVAPSRTRAAKAPHRAAEVPVHGEVHVPVLLIQYSDVKFASADPAATFELHVNGDDYKDEGGYGSVKEYFEDQSEGKFMPKFEILGPVTLNNKMEYYGGNDENGSDRRPIEMIREACKLANASADFSKFDNNGDGYVDIVYAIYAGYGEASNVSTLENTIWPHQWYLDTPLSLDGVQISKYACNNELDGDSGSQIDGIGTFCHEFSHCLGLPDFYPANGTNGFGMNAWSIMDYGCYNDGGHTPCGYTGHELDFLGWKELVLLDAPTDVSLQPMSEGGVAYKIVNDANPNEYYVVENHKRTRWDEHVPAEGMLVIHVDYLESAWQNNSVNNAPSHQRMTIIPADNKRAAASLAGDTYPGSSGNTSLTAVSTPAAECFVGDYMGKDITDISIQDGIVTFSFMKGALLVPEQQAVSDVTESGFTMNWKQVPGIKEYEVQLDLLEENPFVLDEDFDKVKKGTSDIGPTMDKYTNQQGWNGKGIFGLDEAIRIGSASSEGYLFSPRLECDSSRVTLLFAIKQSETSDKDPFVVLAVGDETWGNSLYGYSITVTDKEWTSYFLVLDSIGPRPFLYLDTRKNPENPKAATRVDFDEIYVLDGDRSAELLGEDEESDSTSQAPRRVMPVKAAQRVRSMATWQTSRMPANSYRQVDEENTAEQQNDTLKKKRYYATTIHTARTSALDYRFENLDGGLYRASLRSVRDSVYSRYSNTQDVEIVDSLLPQAISPRIYMNADSVYVEVDDSSAVLYYTLDGTMPTAYAQRYTGPFELKDKAEVNVIARKPAHRRSDVEGFRNWFVADGATYRIESTVNPQASVSEFRNGNTASGYVGYFVVGDSVIADSTAYLLTGIDKGAFRNATALRSIQVEGTALRSVGDSLFHGCTALNAVVWDIDLPLQASMFDQKSYHNLLVYLPGAMDFSHPLVGEHAMTLVRDGACDTLLLAYQYPFYAPRTFTASHVSYSRLFTQTTGMGSSAGWETMALPFDVQRVEHAIKGELAPFGADASSHHFWLSEWSDNGFVPATSIQANTPYLLSMPNNSEYGDYSLNGAVTFSADNAVIDSSDALVVPANAQYRFVPSYAMVEANDSVYALNTGVRYGEYVAGSVFVPDNYAVNPFSAYLLPQENAHRAPMYRIQPQDDVEEAVEHLEVRAEDGIVYITAPEPCAVVIYDMSGRQVRTVQCATGVNEVLHLSTGIYLIEKNKVYVQR